MKKKQVVQQVDPEEQKKLEEERIKREEENRRRKEEYKETAERQAKQKELAEDAARKLSKKKNSWFNSYYLVFGILGCLTVYVVVMLFLNQQPPLNKTPVIEDKRIEEHNQNFPWRQGPNNFFEGASLADAKKIVNTSFASHSNLARCTLDESITPPESFDSRTQWPNCMLQVGNQQKTCGSSYAFAVSHTVAERLCINSKTQKLIVLSPQELLSCDVANSGCKGGYLNNALDYIRTKGIVEESCFPYQADSDTVKCEKMCANPIREKLDSYCILFGEDDIKREIYKNGPVVATTQIHVDFLTYKSGIYHKSDDVPRFSGFQAIKIIGWGVESGSENEPNKGNKYWIVQNSWGDDWGEGGYARISMGQELMFDQYAYAVKMRSDKPTEAKAGPKPTVTTETKKQPQESVESEPEVGDLNLDDVNIEEIKEGESKEKKEEVIEDKKEEVIEEKKEEVIEDKMEIKEEEKKEEVIEDTKQKEEM